MLLLRLLFLLLLAFIAWRAWRLVFAPRRGPAPPRVGRMVRCEVCALHVPEATALDVDGHWFCGEEHRQQYLGGRRPDRP